MIIESQYVYTITVLIGLVFSLTFFLIYKKKRFDISLIGSIIAISSVFTAYFFWTKDWWFPNTLFGGDIGFEDLILGFNAGALAVGIDTLFFREKEKISNNRNYKLVISSCALFMGSMFLCFYIFHYSSFTSCVISILISNSWIYMKSSISPIQGFLFGIIYMILHVPMYFFIRIINSQWITDTWDLNFLSGITFFGFIPAEELIFWFLYGVIFKQIYLAWRKKM